MLWAGHERKGFTKGYRQPRDDVLMGCAGLSQQESKPNCGGELVRPESQSKVTNVLKQELVSASAKAKMSCSAILFNLI
jgi:hypothetical protein